MPNLADGGLTSLTWYLPRRSGAAVGILDAHDILDFGGGDVEDIGVGDRDHAVDRMRCDVNLVARPHPPRFELIGRWSDDHIDLAALDVERLILHIMVLQ